ncbi:polynucleotide kinase-phosphatase [Serinibacter arcticus]|uniref:Serine/threonine protein phosphatase n=1 Tax=Serinibacter arcticus TaxID=1655435 RepID=A0A4Z1E5A5_9MICO|nr:polynucleotide kinase-phosphatase [Serinibacter arcticus]TGO05663.1 Serine/threonine protein phosphatase [Serinibacter arcticus]
MSDTTLRVQDPSLVVLVGVSGSGKSTFAATHFGLYETVSSDHCRGVVSNDPNDQSVTPEAFALLHAIVGARLQRNLLTVVDATNVQPHARKELVALARTHDVLPVAIVLDVGADVAAARNRERPDRTFGSHVVDRQQGQLRKSLRGLQREGFRTVHHLRSEAEIAGVVIERVPLLTDRRHERGPFDAIGDVHGCLPELLTLLDELGYVVERDAVGRPVDAVHPQRRRVIFLGDLVDRGPDSPGVLRLAMGMVRAGHALAVPGNHEDKLVRALAGRDVTVSHGLETTLAQLAGETAEFREEVAQFCRDLVSHAVLDGGALVVAHAGLKQSYHNRASGRVRAFALYGDTTGESDEYGLPVRYPWAQDYRGDAVVLYGHTPVPRAEWVNGTMCLDTGCVFGGALSALRYPEREVVSVPATAEHYAPARPFPTGGVGSSDGGASGRTGAARPADVLDLRDVTGVRVVDTALLGRVSVPEENAAGALEVMSRFALPPRALPYLPPTMSPVATSTLPGHLEHPDEAFASYARDGVGTVVCEEKHMGSRAVVLVCRDDGGTRFGLAPGSPGVAWTRTGRRLLQPDLEGELLTRLRDAVATAGVWDRLDGATWVLLDTEIVPWSLKADELIREQFAGVGAAAAAVVPAALAALDAAAARGVDVGGLRTAVAGRAENAERFRDAYRRYRWDVDGLDGVQLAPFQVLASGRTEADAAEPGVGGSTHETRPHPWHLEIADALVAADPVLIRPTRRLVVDLADEASRSAGVAWWEELTGTGGEGMVVKPLANLVLADRGGRPLQPGLKVRGREYLRIVYGPDYTDEANLARLRQRHLGRKRSLAQREYALGLESLARLVRGEPTWRVHQPVFAVLALESEPVDPRL